MPISKSSRALVATATIALLAGCSGGSMTSPLSSVGSQSISHQSTVGAQSVNHPGFRADTLIVKPDVAQLITGGTPHVIKWDKGASFKGTALVTDSGTNEVYLVSSKGKLKSVQPKGSGWSEPQGVGVDAKGNFYVADTANSRIVVLSAKGKTLAEISDPGQYPVGVAINAKGQIGVSNIISTSDGAGSITFYSSYKAKSATGTATGFLARDYFIGADAEGNFYIDGETDSSSYGVGTVAYGGSTISNTGITPEFLFPGGVNVYTGKDDKKGKGSETLGVGDQSGYQVFNYALPGYAAGPTVSLGGGSDEVQWSLDSAQSVAGAADAGLAQAEFWAWPAGGSSPSGTIGGFSEPIGIGFSPTGVE
jgi:hypothetical protein